MTTTDTSVTSKSAFLDTNALVNLYWYWQACNAAGVGLDTVSEWSGLKTALEGHNQFAAELNRDDAGSVMTGMRCFQNLSSSLGNYQYYSSRVCSSEMHHVLLESLGLEQLLRRHIPHGLRVKRPQVLFRRALQSSDYDQIKSDLSDFFESLNLDYGIDIVEIEQSSAGTAVRSDDVWDIAQEVWSRVLIDVMDSYIYAAAVEIEADAFLTSDSSLLEALANLSNPTGEWIALVTSLKGALGKPAGATLPQPYRPQDFKF